jgi:hypothetical protein
MEEIPKTPVLFEHITAFHSLAPVRKRIDAAAVSQQVGF